MDTAPPTKRKRRSKWDVKAVNPPLHTPTAAPVSVLEAAQSAVARALPSQLSSAVQGLPATQQPTQALGHHPVAPEATVGLCDCSASARRRLVARGTHDEITAKTGAAVTTKGRYFPPGEAAQAGTEALHLHLTGESQEQVDAAVAMVNTMLQTQQQSGVQGRNHASWTAPTAPNPAASVGFSHFLTVGIQPDVAHGFDVTAKLSGPQGSFLTHIGREARCTVSVRGGTSPQDPLGIFIDQAPSHEALRHAVGLAESLLATVRSEFSSWICTKQQLGGSVPPAASPMQPSSVDTYLGPSYASFQSAVKSSQQQSASPSTAGGRIDHVDSNLNASHHHGAPTGATCAATASSSAASSETNSTTGKQQQRSFAAIGFNYNNSNSTPGGESQSDVAPMPIGIPAALKRPRSPPKPQQSDFHRTFQELATSSIVRDSENDSSSSTTTTATTISNDASSTSKCTAAGMDNGANGVSKVAKKAFWMA